MSHRDEVLDYLKREGGWHTTSEITRGIGLDPAIHRSHIHFILTTESKYGDVEKRVERPESGFGGGVNAYWRLVA